jgi:hypothetical protein
MCKLPNIAQIVAMYWEAGRSIVKARQDELFGFDTQPEETLRPFGGAEPDESASGENRAYHSHPTDESLNAEFEWVMRSTSVRSRIRELMTRHWEAGDFRSEVVAIESFRVPNP